MEIFGDARTIQIVNLQKRLNKNYFNNVYNPYDQMQKLFSNK